MRSTTQVFCLLWYLWLSWWRYPDIISV